MYSLEAAFQFRIDTVLFDPVTLKMISTGRGDASKSDMQRAVQLDTVNPDTIMADEADAYCVAKHAARFMLLRSGDLSPDDLSKKEKSAFLERKRKKKSILGKTVIVKRTAHIFRENNRFFSFSSIPEGDVNLPDKSMINSDLLQWLESGSVT